MIFNHFFSIFSSWQWNVVCSPALQRMINKAKQNAFPVNVILRALVVECGAAFQADFRDGKFKKWLTTLDEEIIAEILSIYLTFLIQLCAQKGYLLQISSFQHIVREDELWDAAAKQFKNINQVRKNFGQADGDKLADEISRMYLRFYSAVCKRIKKCPPELDLRPSDILFLHSYHIELMSSLADDVGRRLLVALNDER